MKKNSSIKVRSKIGLEAHQQTGGGIHGKRGAGRSKGDPRSRQDIKASLRRGVY